MYPLKTKTKYDPANLASIWTTYTTVYLGNYVSGDFDEGSGSHCGVDIVPMVKNDAVSAVLDGTVVKAEFKAADGNVVVIKHENVPDPDDFSKTTTLYSAYLHLDTLAVGQGASVKEGDVIGTSGNTGNSTGEHLHFQIDRAEAPSHPYWPFTMGEAQEAGLGFLEAVNRGLGLEKARKFTVNPLVYLDRVSISSKKPVSTPTAPVPEKPAEVVSKAAEKVTVASEVIKPLPSSSVGPFSDVPATHPYAESIAYVKDQGIATGSNGTFRPDAPVTRAEILKMAFIASGKPLSKDKASRFTDVIAGSWALPYVNTARELGAVSGYSDGTFRPNAPVTRAEALKIALKILSVVPDGVSFKAFSDVDASAWYAPYAAWAKSAGVFGAATFRPDSPSTRAEVAGIIHAALTA